MWGWLACADPVEPTVADVGLGYELPADGPGGEVALVWPEHACAGRTVIDDRANGVVGEAYLGFPAGQPTWAVYEGEDANGNQLPEFERFTERDAAGNAVRTERTRSAPEVVESTFDARGNALTVYTDGYAGTSYETLTWDPNDELLEYTYDLYADGQVDYALWYTRDAAGVRQSAVVDGDGDGDIDETYQWAYDDMGRASLLEVWLGPDPDPDQRYTFVYTDPERWVGQELADEDMDGAPEWIVGFAFTADGDQVYEATDDDADGVWEYETTWTYDTDHRPTSEAVTSAVSTYTNTWAFDALGRVVRSTQWLEWYGEVRIDVVRDTTYQGDCS